MPCIAILAQASMWKRLRSWETDEHDFRGSSDDDIEAVRRDRLNASRELEEMLLRQYVSGHMDAKSFCVTCYWAARAGAVGDNLQTYGRRPGLQSGKYKDWLNKKLPVAEAAPEYCMVDVPMFVG
eukprot:5776918-Pyramimonas_sp.AAC.1